VTLEARTYPTPADHGADRVEALTGLRFLAALAIVLHHLQGLLWLPADAFDGIALYQGVTFFYVLSGFILQHSYAHRLGMVGGGITPAQFIALRFFRLWPCHIAVLALLIAANSDWILGYFRQTYTLEQILAAVFLLQAWSTDAKTVFALNGPAWSISAEMFFYVMFPWLCREALKSALRPIYIGAAIAAAWLAVIWSYMPDGNLQVLLVTNPLARILEFATGIACYELFARSARRFRSGTGLETVALAIATLSLTVIPLVSAIVVGRMWLLIALWLGNLASVLAFAALIVVIFRNGGGPSKLVGSKPLAYLGEISFALYLVHQPVIFYLARSAPWFGQLALAAQVMVFAVVVLGLSSALHHLVERPCMNLSRHLILRR